MNNVTSLVPVHPGKYLVEKYMDPLGISVDELATDLRVAPALVSDIIAGRKGVTADTAMRLGRYFRTTSMFWMKMQGNYDIHAARIKYAKSIARIRPMKGRERSSADVLKFRS